MTVQSKNHHASDRVSLNVSQASREMSHEPKLQFADLEQERDFWMKEKRECEAQFAALKEELKAELRKASARARNGGEFIANKSACEIVYEEKSKPIRQRLRVIEGKLQEIKLRRRQQSDREHNMYLLAKAEKEKDPNRSGKVDLGPVMIEVLAELRKMNATLERIEKANDA